MQVLEDITLITVVARQSIEGFGRNNLVKGGMGATGELVMGATDELVMGATEMIFLALLFVFFFFSSLPYHRRSYPHRQHYIHDNHIIFYSSQFETCVHHTEVISCYT